MYLPLPLSLSLSLSLSSSLLRTLPRGIIIGIPIVIFCYIFVNIAFFAGLSKVDILSSPVTALVSTSILMSQATYSQIHLHIIIQSQLIGVSKNIRLAHSGQPISINRIVIK